MAISRVPMHRWRGAAPDRLVACLEQDSGAWVVCYRAE